MDGESDSMAHPESYVSAFARNEQQRGSKHSRAISSVAQSFAADLDSMFGLSVGIATLEQTVEEKKASVSSGQSELEQLEAKLREMEQRLAKVSRQNSPSRPADGSSRNNEPNAPTTKQPSPLSQRPTYPEDRPPTARRPQTRREEAEARAHDMRDAMPAQPAHGQVGGRDDYVMVDGRT